MADNKYAHMLAERPTQAVVVNYADETAWLDAVEDSRALVDRYQRVANVVRETEFIDPERSMRTLRLIGAWQAAHLARLHDLTEQRERALKPAAPNGRPHAEVKA